VSVQDAVEIPVLASSDAQIAFLTYQLPCFAVSLDARIQVQTAFPTQTVLESLVSHLEDRKDRPVEDSRLHCQHLPHLVPNVCCPTLAPLLHLVMESYGNLSLLLDWVWRFSLGSELFDHQVSGWIQEIHTAAS